jgi:regulator of nucleoside diphosphate kinase
MKRDMSSRTIYITEFDYNRLKTLIQEAEYGEYRGSDYIKNLGTELDKSKIVRPQEVPGDVITMNSKVCLLDIEVGEEEEITLVFPEDADRTQNKISVLAPIGTAMLGHRAGDTIEWEGPAGLIRMKVKELLYQPESSGDYHL